MSSKSDFWESQLSKDEGILVDVQPEMVQKLLRELVQDPFIGYGHFHVAIWIHKQVLAQLWKNVSNPLASGRRSAAFPTPPMTYSKIFVPHLCICGATPAPPEKKRGPSALSQPHLISNTKTFERWLQLTWTGRCYTEATEGSSGITTRRVELQDVTHKPDALLLIGYSRSKQQIRLEFFGYSSRENGFCGRQ